MCFSKQARNRRGSSNRNRKSSKSKSKKKVAGKKFKPKIIKKQPQILDDEQTEEPVEKPKPKPRVSIDAHMFQTL